MTERTGGNGIVVGVDGSEASMAALRWAADEARARHTEVVVVHAWEQAAFGYAPYAPAAARPTAAEQRERAAEVLATAVREALGPRIGAVVRGVVVEGPPVRVLLRQSRGALLLALGRRAHGGFGLPSVGAVSRECLRYATVPVVTVPAPDRPVSRPVSRPGAVESSSLAGSGGVRGRS
ncbi:UspA domain-containing protein [Actinobacteria bacterium OK074]|nr:UspA domain-containing protein [Actinobacteria bacterium OK074]